MLITSDWFKSHSLSNRLTASYSVGFLLFLGFSFLLLYLSVASVLDDRIDEDLTEDLIEFSQWMDSDGIDRVIAEIDEEVKGGDHESVFLRLYTNDATLIYSSSMDYWKELVIDEDLIRASFSQHQVILEPVFRSLNLPLQEAATRIAYNRIGLETVLVIGESVESRDEIMELLLKAFVVVFLLAIPVAAALIWVLTRSAISGITAVSEAALDIKSGNLNRRVTATNQALEVQTLADTFDAMADRIQVLISNMREMTDNMAHDLRSPIGRVRILSESLLKRELSVAEYQDNARQTIDECDRLIQMINVSLDVAETEAGVTGQNRESLNLAAMIRETSEFFEPVAEERGVNLIVNVEGSWFIQGDQISIQRMLINLLDNALKFTPEGEVIELGLQAYEADQLSLAIRNTGIGIAEVDQIRIFNRFFRVDSSRSTAGCGLGLSYIQAVIKSHGGTISVQSDSHSFTEFVIHLPILSETMNEPADSPLRPIEQGT